ncbi:MAG: acetyl-CoA decarbonylase/synthase complex subunit gamma [Nitrososphaerales archaeon]
MPKKIGPLMIYPLLPKTNCGRCPPKVCMGFAVQLTDRSLSLEDCPPLFEEKKYEENLKKLRELLAPSVREVIIGSKEKQVKIGGKLVLRRHELRYSNPTTIAVLIDDGMKDEDISKWIDEVNSFRYRYVGMDLTLDMLAIRSTSKDQERFEKVIKKVADKTNLPMVLWAESSILERGLKVVEDRRPLIYAATKDNWGEIGAIALKYKCPLAIYSPNDIKMLKSLVNTLKSWGIEDFVLDIGAAFGKDIAATINNLTMMRISAIEEKDELLAYPLLGIPVRIWDEENGKSPELLSWEESCLASMMLIRYVDMLIIRRATFWSTLPLLILRNNIYNDPRKPVSVEPGLRVVGNPNEDSPVLVTSNFALTFYTVMGDIEKLDCYILVADSEGLSVESAIAGRKLTAEKIAEIIRFSKIEEKIKHRTIIIPGLAARLKGDIEDATKWDVLVGPRDSSMIQAFLKEKWYGKDHTPGWSYK